MLTVPARRRPISQPVRAERRAHVDVDLAEVARAGVRESMRRVRRDDHDIVRARDDLLAGDEEGRLALERDEDLLVGVGVLSRAVPWHVVGEDQADARAPMISPYQVVLG